MILLNFLKHFKYVSKFEKKKCSNSERFFFLSKVQLEEFRNSAHELRWQAEEDFSECQKCHTPFTVTWRRSHCRKFIIISFKKNKDAKSFFILFI